MRVIGKFLLIVCPLSLSVGCAHMFQSTAKVVSTKPGKGGEIAIYKGMDGEENARKQASAHMTSTCGEKKYKIVEEGEVVTGQVMNKTSDSSASSNFRNVSGSETATTSNTTEWRIKYECDTKVI